MRIAGSPAPLSVSDLTARARIRDAAIEAFAEEGFGAPLRGIAERASVSPGLITHHFGAKSALREACDAEVLRRYRAVKTEGMAQPGAHLTAMLTAPGMSATTLVYVLRAISAGGPPARQFLDRLIDDVRSLMASGVASGLVRPSRDEEARLRHLTYQGIGALLVQFLTEPHATPEQFVASLQSRQQDAILPTLELYTEGLLATSELLDGYLQYVEQAPTTTASGRERL